MKPGLVLAIEPMINLGKKEVKQLDDRWTIITKDNYHLLILNTMWPSV